MTHVVTLPEQLKVNDPVFQECVAIATSALKDGGIIALPTDTIYGIAGLAQSTEAVQQLYEIKGRHCEKPIAISVGDVGSLKKWGKVSISDQLLSRLLPGAVTLVLERTDALNKELNPHTSNVGIRIPDHLFVRQLAVSCGEPLALTSANKSATKSSLDVKEFQNLWEKLACIFDGGVLGDTEECRKGSTVVNLSVPGRYKIIREGSAYMSTVETLKEFGLNETTS